jgi:hypothetical protein
MPNVTFGIVLLVSSPQFGSIDARHLETMVTEHTLQVTVNAAEKIVDTDHISAPLEQALAEMRAEKAGAASDQYTSFEVQSQSPQGRAIKLT